MSEGIRFEGVTFSYPGSGRPALRDVSVRVPQGSFALAFGPTGAGKSTLLRAANGLVPHFSGGVFSGQVSAAGRDTLEHAPRELADVVAFVPQDPSASFVLDRVEDELAYGMENLAVPRPQMRRRVEEVLDLLDIERLRSRSVRTLSGGQRQRVAIAAALAAGPGILVLDEPTSQLDPQGAEDVLAALQRLVHDHGMTVLLAEHRLERVAGFVDLALGCRDGTVRLGAPAEMFEELGGGPPVTRLGRLVGWRPLPLTVREARTMAKAVRLPAPVEETVARAAADGILLAARGLRAGYGATEVLRDVAVDVTGGETVAVMGRNGSGKTTLLRCLAGVHKPFTGEVLAAGGRNVRSGVDVALCPQEPESILFSDTVAGEVLTTTHARGHDRRPVPTGGQPKAEAVLSRLRIEHLADRHPRDLSAGQRLLVATAAVASTGAPVVLLDEPTRGLDPESKGGLAGFLRSHAAAGGASMFATHDVELAAAVATRVVMLAGGEVIADGPPALVLGDSHVFAPQMTRVFGPGWLTPEQVAGAVAGS